MYAILMQDELHIRNIRARRQEPGLRPQHLKVLEAAVQLSGARIEGGFVGSEEIRFKPQPVIRGGNYRWDIGTAGSTVMLAHSLLPLALFAERASIYTLTGGLFQDFAPSAYHFQFALLPLLRKMGVTADAKILCPGYVPRGGGEIEVTIQPLNKNLKSLESLHLVAFRVSRDGPSPPISRTGRFRGEWPGRAGKSWSSRGTESPWRSCTTRRTNRFTKNPPCSPGQAWPCGRRPIGAVSSDRIWQGLAAAPRSRSDIRSHQT